MGEKLREGTVLVRRTLAGTFDFTGRSRRLEVAWYWFFAAVVGGVEQIAAETWLGWKGALIAEEAFGAMLWIPFFALFARRLHDHGQSGWWVLLLPALIAHSLYKSLKANLFAFDPDWPEPGCWTLGLLPVAVLVMVFVVAEGQIGSNQYGPDPRLEPDRRAHA